MKVVKRSKDKKKVTVVMSTQEVDDLHSAVTFTHREYEKIREKAPSFKKCLKRADKDLQVISKGMGY